MSGGGSAPPLPGSAGFVTPPQAGTSDRTFGPASKGAIQQFFDPTRYHGRTSGLDEMKPWVPQPMITSRENVIRFFNPRTYSGGCCPEKRPAPSEHGSTTSSAPRAKAKMSRDELLSKFKLAAEFNGISWDEMSVPMLNMVIYIFLILFVDT